MEKTISSQVVYHGKILHLRVDQVQLQNNAVTSREVVEHPGAVAIIAVTGDQEILLVRQYRHAVQCETLEIPAGKMERDEDPLFTAQRELVEETGYRAGIIKPLLHFYTTPGFCNEEMHLFWATELVLGQASPDPDEFLAVKKVPLQEALFLIKNGVIRDAKSIAGILHFSQMNSGGISF